jgi:catechol 2,3-dioxygenase-like lactoylglutathione lyase family enzyme
MVQYHFHHVSLLTGDKGLAKTCEYFYTEMLGLQIVKPAGETSEEGFSFLSDRESRDQTPFEIMGDVFEERERLFIEMHGPRLDHICFAVDDMDQACESLTSAGVAFHILPYKLQDYRLAWCKDPIGTEIELIQLPDDFHDINLDFESQGINAKLSHVGILVGDDELARITEKFYTEKFGMRKIMHSFPHHEEMTRVYLEDSSSSNPFWLEVAGDVIFDEEKAFLEKYGPGIDHLCLFVEDVNAACDWLKENEVKIEIEPLDSDAQRMFFVRDPVGVTIQLIEKLD